jgi:hypothetical protein
VLVAGPLLFGLSGLIVARREPTAAVSRVANPWNWKQVIQSMLLYALAFNLIFFIQELFLVLPKAFTPGLRPTLFHNNHRWEGENPLAALFQGTGALAIFVTGLICAFLVKRRAERDSSARLFLIWMAYNGFFQSLPQVVIGSIEPENDVGMAMDYLQLGASAKMAAAFVALIAIPAMALSLRAPLLSMAENPSDISGIRARTSFVFRIATLPAVTAILLILPFRVPRNWVEVVAVPVVVTMLGLAWLQSAAWAVAGSTASGTVSTKSVIYAFGTLLILLLAFQFVLRPGVRFY